MPRALTLLLGSAVLGTGEDSEEEPLPLPVPPFEGPCGWGTDDPSLSRLCEWLRDDCHATGLENVFFGNFVHGDQTLRGLGARKALNKGDSAICVPKTCWFAKTMVSDRIKQVAQSEEDHLFRDCTNDMALAVLLAEERVKGAESRWFPFMSYLPSEDEYKGFHPAYFKVDENATYKNVWADWSSRLATCYEHYKASVGDTAVPYDEVYLSLVQLYSRRFGEVDLVPLADALNSDSDDVINLRSSYKGEDLTNFCVEVIHPVRPGQELLVDYGLERRDALAAFELWGFWLDPDFHEPMGTALGVTPEQGCTGLTTEEVFKWPWKTDTTSKMYRRFSELHCSEPESKRQRQARLRILYEELGVANAEYTAANASLKSLRTLLAAAFGFICFVAWFAILIFCVKPEKPENEAPPPGAEMLKKFFAGGSGSNKEEVPDSPGEMTASHDAAKSGSLRQRASRK